MFQLIKFLYTCIIDVFPKKLVERSTSLATFVFFICVGFYFSHKGWPSVDSKLKTAVFAYNNQGTGSGSVSNSLAPETNPIIDTILKILEATPDYLLQILAPIFRFQSVAGHLDDLLGQQLFIHLCLFFLMFCIIILFIVYAINNILLHNKDVFLNYFDNKYIKLYINYQIFLGKISIVIMPIVILFFMFGLMKGLYFLITHPVPFECLDIDLHTFVKRK